MGGAAPPDRGAGVGIWVAVLCAVMAVPLISMFAPEVRCAALAPRSAARKSRHALLVRRVASTQGGCVAHAQHASVRLSLRRWQLLTTAAVRWRIASPQLTNEVSVGIDLGTTFSVVAVCQHGQVSVVEARAAAAARRCNLARAAQPLTPPRRRLTAA